MEFLGIGPFELFFIVLLALIILGPKDMVKAGRAMGKFLRRTILSPEWMNIQKSVRNLPNQLMREAGIDENDLKIDVDMKELTDAAAGVSSTIKEELSIAPEWLNPPDITRPEPPISGGDKTSIDSSPSNSEDDKTGQN